MSESVLRRLWKVAAGVLVLPVLAATPWGARAALGVFAGGVWNLANLWCLTRLLGGWLSSQRSKRLVVGWLLVKFPLLYAAAFLMLRHPAVSMIGFGIGFSVVLVTAVCILARHAREMVTPAPHGR